MAFYSANEQQLLDRIATELQSIDRYAREPLSNAVRRVARGFAAAGSREIRHQDKREVLELALSIHFDVKDPQGKDYPEVRLQSRQRSLSPVTRKVRELFGFLPRARVLVLTPAGYRVTLLRNLDSRRFARNGRANLAPYNPSSVIKLSSLLLDVFGKHFQEPG